MHFQRRVFSRSAFLIASREISETLKQQFAEQSSRLRAERSNESPSGAFKRQNGLAPARWRGFAPTSSATMHRMQTMQGKTRLSRRCAKVCRAPENGKSHEESYDSSWDFGALEGTRIPGPLIKRIQGVSFVKSKKHEEAQIHSYYRKIHICTHRIICTQWNDLQPLSSYSGVQKVCKNVQTGKTKPNGQINHRFYGRVQDIRTDTV